MANTKRDCSFVFIAFMAAFVPYFSNAYQFNVGNRAGWVVKPPENYNHWAGRLRFQVNDTLFFKYNKGSNSVLEVNRDDYSQCNVNNPILRLDNGNSIFKFNRSGPFYFISGNKTFCDQGQKLIVVVLAIRHRHPPLAPPPAGQPPALAPSTSPSPASTTVPSPAPVSSPGPSISPISPSPGQPPALAPASSPSTSPSSAPVTSPSPAPTTVPSPAPVSSPGPSISPIPPSPVATPPSNASTPGSSPVTPPPPPSSSGETPPPSGPSPPSSSGSPPVSPTPPSSTNSVNSNSPSSAATRPAFTPSVISILAVSTVFTVTFGAPIFH